MQLSATVLFGFPQCLYFRRTPEKKKNVFCYVYRSCELFKPPRAFKKKSNTV